MTSLATPRFEVRGKVRVGVRRRLADGREVPSSVDYFISDDAEFARVYPERTSEIAIVLPYDRADQCLTQTLEAWKGSVLACQSLDATVAHRRTRDGSTFDPSAPRMAIDCPYRACSWWQAGDCKLTGRLRFFLRDGSDRSQVLQLDTRGFGSIEGMQAALGLGERLGPLGLVEAVLRVRMETRDRKKFPVVTIALGQATGEVRELDELRALLVEQGKADDPMAIAWVRRVGVDVALEKLRARQQGAAS